MGTVWRGEDLVLGRVVAVKEVGFPPGASLTEQEILRERIRREARAAAALDHPDTVTVHDVVEEGPATYLVMQYVAARTVAEVIGEDGPMSPSETARVGLAVLGALRAAHALGIVHRDVKPSNVLLCEGDGPSLGRVFLTDFGIASSPGDARLTSTGLLIGSPGYIAPERARGEVPGPASDLWSLGATLFTAVEGNPPYDGDDPMTTLALVMVGEHAPFVRAGPLRPVIVRLLDRDPVTRMSATDADKALRAVLSAHQNGVVAPTTPTRAVAPHAAARTAVMHLAPPGATGAEPSVAPRRPSAPDRSHVVCRKRTSKLWAAALVGAAVVLAVVLGGVLLVGGFLDAGTLSGDGPENSNPPSTAAPQSTAPPQSAESQPDPPGLAALPADADTPDEQLNATVDGLADLTSSASDAAGADGDEVLADLRDLQALEGAVRRSAAIVVHDSVGAAVSAGTLNTAVGQRIQEVLDAVIRPERLVDLVALLDVDPTAMGSDGQQVFEALFALDHVLTADEIAPGARDALELVTASAEEGALREPFRAAAVPLLTKLGDPSVYRALQDLLADVEANPGSVGSAEDEVLSTLREMAVLPVFDTGNRALDLLELIRGEGNVTSEFRRAATPVLTALVR